MRELLPHMVSCHHNAYTCLQHFRESGREFYLAKAIFGKRNICCLILPGLAADIRLPALHRHTWTHQDTLGLSGLPRHIWTHQDKQGLPVLSEISRTHQKIHEHCKISHISNRDNQNPPTDDISAMYRLRNIESWLQVYWFVQGKYWNLLQVPPWQYIEYLPIWKFNNYVSICLVGNWYSIYLI